MGRRACCQWFLGGMFILGMLRTSTASWTSAILASCSSTGSGKNNSHPTLQLSLRLRRDLGFLDEEVFLFLELFEEVGPFDLYTGK